MRVSGEGMPPRIDARRIRALIVSEPIEAAKAAGLRYVSDRTPGIRRKQAGRSFSFIGPDGKPIRDRAEVARITSLAIPPAYTDVWICLLRNGHLQATGRDARGRKQYRYHQRWRAVRDENKYSRMILFGRTLPKIRAAIDADLALAGIPRRKALAAVVRLLETSSIRVGNEEYAKSNKSFGLTTLRGRHVDIDGATMRFHFRGKSGKEHEIDVRDRRLARIVKTMRDLPGQELFGFIDEDGKRQSIDSGDVNEYLREISGDDFTAKDFRTWAGTVVCAAALGEIDPFASAAEAKKNVTDAVKRVAERLGNTPAICRKCYVHPAILESYLEGTLLDALTDTSGSAAEEALEAMEGAVLKLLVKRLEGDQPLSARKAS